MAHVTRPIAYFSPHGGCTEAIVAMLDAARKTVRGISYSFTSEPIADAILRAHERGVDVSWIVDARMCNERAGQAHRLKAAGVDIVADDKHPICHDKYFVTDDLYVKTGSHNDSRQSENNAENVVIQGDAELARAFGYDWITHRRHAIPLPPPRVGAELPPLVEVVAEGSGWRIAVDGVTVGPTWSRDNIATVDMWLRAALPGLAAALAPGDAEAQP